MKSQLRDNHEDMAKDAQERALSVTDYNLSLMVAMHIGARWGHCYENAYSAFFAFLPLFEPHGTLVEGWIVFEDKGNVVLMEHGWLQGSGHLIDPTIVLVVDPGQTVSYFPGVLRGHRELEMLENELFPHVRFSDYGDDGLSHCEYRVAYEAAQLKARSLLTAEKTFVEVKAKVCTDEEQEATKSAMLDVRIVLLPGQNGRGGFNG